MDARSLRLRLDDRIITTTFPLSTRTSFRFVLSKHLTRPRTKRPDSTSSASWTFPRRGRRAPCFDRRHHARRIIVIDGILLMIVWSFWLGLLVIFTGLVGLGGFVRGRWY